MRLRFLGGALLALFLVLFMAVTAAAEEEEELDDHADQPLPSIEEVGTGTEVAEEFQPELPEPAPFTGALLWPLMGAAFLVAFIVLVLYLRWMPRFSREREGSSRR